MSQADWGLLKRLFEAPLKVDWKAVDADLILKPGTPAATVNGADDKVRASPRDSDLSAGKKCIAASEGPLSAGSVLDRMREAISLNSDSELAEWLRTSRSTVSKWRKRNAVPYAEAVFVALMGHATIEYLLLGKDDGEQFTQDKIIDKDFIIAPLLNLYAMDYCETQNGKNKADVLNIMSKKIAHQYSRAMALRDKLVNDHTLGPTEARIAAIRALELMSSDGSLFKADDVKTPAKPHGPEKGPQSGRRAKQRKPPVVKNTI